MMKLQLKVVFSVYIFYQIMTWNLKDLASNKGYVKIGLESSEFAQALTETFVFIFTFPFGSLSSNTSCYDVATMSKRSHI